VKPPTWWEILQKYWRMWMRLLKLTFHLTPVIAFYPILLTLSNTKPDNVDVREFNMQQQQQQHEHNKNGLQSTDDDDDDEEMHGFMKWYLNMCLRCVEASGAAVIKLMQWAGSRPDMFGHEFCRVFSKLQDETTPHPWSHTELVLRNSFGPHWRQRVEMGPLLGSGCIGQVYKGRVRAHVHGNDDWQDVAIKILHPNVRADIDADLDLMRMAVRIAKYIPILADLKWLDMENVVEEFADLLQLQLDLRHEAANLQRFNDNFKDEPATVFPKLVPGFPPTRHCLVESFCEGIPVMEFARNHQDQPDVLQAMCLNAIRTVCKMIFLDNFMHGTLAYKKESLMCGCVRFVDCF
jgi:aarF domain-containing kinase